MSEQPEEIFGCQTRIEGATFQRPLSIPMSELYVPAHAAFYFLSRDEYGILKGSNLRCASIIENLVAAMILGVTAVISALLVGLARKTLDLNQSLSLLVGLFVTGVIVLWLYYYGKKWRTTKSQLMARIEDHFSKKPETFIHVQSPPRKRSPRKDKK